MTCQLTAGDAAACPGAGGSVARPRLLCLLILALSAPPVSAALPEPVEIWRWNVAEETPRDPILDSTPVVAQLTDDNADGRIDDEDDPDVAFLHVTPDDFGSYWTGRVTVLDGATGAFHGIVFGDFGIPDLSLGGSMLAAADTDRDGRVELVLSSRDSVVVHEALGPEILRRSWPEPLPAADEGIGAGLSLADVDGDGEVEVVGKEQVVSLGAGPTWSALAPSSARASFHGWSHAVDLRPDLPGLEVLAGNRLFTGGGDLLWEAPVPSGATAVGDLDGDGRPEIVLVQRGDLYVISDEGDPLAGPHDLVRPDVAEEWASDPVLADFTGDGRIEIVVPAQTALRCLRFEGGALTELWATPIRDRSCCTGATAHDLDGDGAADLAYRDEQGWFLIRGSDGSIEHSGALDHGTGVERPVIADIDGDCEAELLLGHRSGPGTAGFLADTLVAFDLPGAASAPALSNQRAWHRTHVDDAGLVPAAEPAPWLVGAGWGLQSTGDCVSTCTAAILGADEDPACVRDGLPLRVEVLQDGALVAPESVEWSSDCLELRFESGADDSSTVLFGEEGCLLACTLVADAVLPSGAECRATTEIRIDASAAPALEDLPPDIELDCAEDLPDPLTPTVVDCDPDVALSLEESRDPGDCPADFDLRRVWTARDRCGHVTRAERVLSVRDRTPPRLTESDRLIACLWPPDHRMACFDLEELGLAPMDDCSEVTQIRLVRVDSDQPDDGTGDGAFVEDVRLAADGRSFCVRAERLGDRPEGRTYRVLAAATDACGNESEPTLVGVVRVPHDRRTGSGCGR